MFHSCTCAIHGNGGICNLELWMPEGEKQQ
jgi:hypothetical protein